VPTRLSNLLAPTLREDPAGADVLSHRLLVRAGYVRRVAAGIWTWLPLGLRVLDRVTDIVRHEMGAIGGQELRLPALLPSGPYQVSGRWAEYGEGIFRLKDRRNADYLLGPTHEELFALLVKSECSSYKDLPLILYQVQTKYRDEARPRAGMLRGREFVMKDSYSFDVDDEGLHRSYDLHRSAYIRCFDHLGLQFHVVLAVSGAMGGSVSEEFVATSDAGEDSFVTCPACGYAANIEAVEVPVPAGRPIDQAPALRVLDTPNTPTIESLVALLRAKGLDVRAGDTLKNVVVKLRHPGGDADVVIVGVPGDRELDERRLQARVEPLVVEPFTDEDFAAHPGLIRGYIGPQVLRELGLRYLVDSRVTAGSSWVTGANEPGRHATGVTYGRDFDPDGIIQAADIRAGDPCPGCGSDLHMHRGIEIGHVFQLGRRYTDAFGVDVAGPDGAPIRLTMGSYGIGLSRTVAAIAEQTADDSGLRWPRAVAPYDVHVCVVGRSGQLEAAESLAVALEAGGLSVLLDDRGQSPGVQFTDAELLGMPTIIVVGRDLAAGEVELRDRWSGTRRSVALDRVVTDVLAASAGEGETAPAH
jgi:prolyl-tRNA synthetase